MQRTKKLEEKKIKTREQNKGRKIKTLLSSPIHLAHHRSTVELLSLCYCTDIAMLSLCCRSAVSTLMHRYCSAVAPPLSLCCCAAITPLSHWYCSTVAPLNAIIKVNKIAPWLFSTKSNTPQRRKTHAPDSHQWSPLPWLCLLRRQPCEPSNWHQKQIPLWQNSASNRMT